MTRIARCLQRGVSCNLEDLCSSGSKGSWEVSGLDFRVLAMGV